MTGDTQWIGSMPELYDRGMGPALFQPYAGVLGEAVSGHGPRRVLELAAGTGIATAALVRHLPDADVHATDLNPAMVDVGRVRVPDATWATADAMALSVPDASYDAVVCQFGVMFFPDRPAAYAEVRRVLVPGGVFAFLTWDVASRQVFAQAMEESLAAVLPQDPPSFFVRIPHGYADPDVILGDVSAGGLVDGSVEHVKVQGRADDVAVLSEAFCLGTPMRFALEQRGSLDELTAAVTAEMVDRLGPGPVEGDLAAWLVTSRSPDATGETSGRPGDHKSRRLSGR